jgi:lipopolysaccharide transport system ATP-binding protein
VTRPIIEVQNISKKYRLGDFGAGSLREEAEILWRRLRKKNGHHKNGNGTASASEFWALKDVSFTVQPGEIVAVIGRNGSGKSTLLKILSRITEPTAGEVIMRGRIASLLEIGTGFHPELSGRENVYLNGAILGMTKAEIARKFDEIVTFAEIEQFIDTPVKRYSSGMYVRLAFAVAAHLDPEILAIDEVLAVGDDRFQQRCVDKMRALATGEGKTLLFVSHNMNLVRDLCTTGVLLQSGSVADCGPIQSVVNGYIAGSKKLAETDLKLRTDRRGTGRSRITKVEIQMNGRPATTIPSGESVEVIIRYTDHFSSMACFFNLSDRLGAPVAHFNSILFETQESAELDNTLRCRIRSLALSDGEYHLSVCLRNGEEYLDDVESAVVFTVEGSAFSRLGLPVTDTLGRVILDQEWILPAAI